MKPACAMKWRRPELPFVRQRSLPVRYKNRQLDQYFQIDMIVADTLLLEIKAVHQIHPLHEAQLQTYVTEFQRDPDD